MTPPGLGPRDSTGVSGVLRGGDDRSDICWDRLLIGIFILISNDDDDHDDDDDDHDDDDDDDDDDI